MQNGARLIETRALGALTLSAPGLGCMGMSMNRTIP